MRKLRAQLTPANMMALAALVVATGGLTYAAIPSRTGVITACYQKKGGELRVIDDRKRCAKGEKKLTWNRRGRRGVPGAQGAPGTVDTSNFYTKAESDSRFQPRISCPAGTVAVGGECVETTLRASDAAVDAADMACASSGRRLPSVAELQSLHRRGFAIGREPPGFEHELTSAANFDQNGMTTNIWVEVVLDDGRSTGFVSYTDQRPYRCVAPAS